ncbi:MAG TPA: ABC transporter permease [Cyclobacteriaceae bacterium]|nr:ABC transporter permease [Cyclobacteriaceae bacterium]
MARRLLLWFLRDDLAEEVQGDLEEKFYSKLNKKSLLRAKINYWFQVLNYLRPFAIQKRNSIRLNHYSMLQNYYKISWRTTLKYKGFSFINIFGLALALAVCMLIILMLADQKSYDQFNKKKDRTYRILSKVQKSLTPNASSPFPLAATLKGDYQIIEESTNLMPKVGGDATYNQRSVEMRGYFADNSFFNVFSFELEKGNTRNALVLPGSMIITSEMAGLLFQDEDPIGKRVEFADRGLGIIKLDFGSETDNKPADWGSYNITGIIDSKKYNSHLKFDALISTSTLPRLSQEKKISDLNNDWREYSVCYTYVVLKPGKSELELTTSLIDIVAHKYADNEYFQGFKLIPQVLTKITPGIFLGNPPSLQLPVEVYYFLGFLALVILISACMNYMNLSIARAITRVKEIGIRKINGANRKNLIFQFLSESILVALLSFILANMMLLFVKPAFKGLWINQYLNFNLNGSISVYIIFLSITIFIGIVAGVVPAFHLSRFAPIYSLKHLSAERPGKLRMRKVLSSVQFIVSLFFIITSILIARQYNHFLKFEYGFNSRNILNVRTQGNNYQILANELGSVKGVSTVSACEFIPAVGQTNGTGARKSGSDEEYTGFEHLRVDPNFLNNMGLKIIAGKNLPSQSGEDKYILVNETAVRSLGYAFPNEIVGQLLEVSVYSTPVEVIGVFKDFRFQTPVMEDKIRPLILRNQPEYFCYLNIKIAPGNIRTTIADLEEKWKSIDPVHPFRYQFFDDELVKVNQWIGDVVSIIGFIAFIAVIIACLGMLGMATYAVERRTKEVGIRKVLGAEVFRISLLLSGEFLTILIVSIIVAAPLSYIINNFWLQHFPNRVGFGVGTILTGSLLLFILGLIPIVTQSFRASKSNPVDVLRME